MSARAGPPMLPPLILVAARDEVFRRSLESVITQGGYRVASATDAESTLLQTRSRQPDAIILDAAIAPSPDFAFCRILRIDAGLSAATPIIVTTMGHVVRRDQLQALRAGAWELRGDPLDLEELLLRLGVYVSGKIEAEQLGADAMLDRVSGLYNTAGLMRRSEELASLSARHKQPVACVVFRPADGKPIGGAEADRLAAAFKQAGRLSDAVARTGLTEFTVFAPDTDEAGAAGLVHRISDAVARRASVGLRAGISSAPAAAVPGSSLPEDLFARARAALGRS